jgi:hypothetical protein
MICALTQSCVARPLSLLHPCINWQGFLLGTKSKDPKCNKLRHGKIYKSKLMNWFSTSKGESCTLSSADMIYGQRRNFKIDSNEVWAIIIT